MDVTGGNGNYQDYLLKLAKYSFEATIVPLNQPYYQLRDVNG